MVVLAIVVVLCNLPLAMGQAAVEAAVDDARAVHVVEVVVLVAMDLEPLQLHHFGHFQIHCPPSGRARHFHCLPRRGSVAEHRKHKLRNQEASLSQ